MTQRLARRMFKKSILEELVASTMRLIFTEMGVG